MLTHNLLRLQPPLLRPEDKKVLGRHLAELAWPVLYLQRGVKSILAWDRVWSILTSAHSFDYSGAPVGKKAE